MMKYVRKVFTSLILLLFLWLIGTVLLQVTSRYLSRFELFSWIPIFPWTEELSRVLFIGIISFAGILVMKERGYARVEIVAEKLKNASPPAFTVYELLVNLLVLVFFICFSLGAYQFTRIGFRSTTPTLSLPFWIVFGMTLVFGIFVCAELLIHMGGNVRHIVHQLRIKKEESH